jgi:lipopolysaccharide transport system ATP-binding protein
VIQAVSDFTFTLTLTRNMVELLHSYETDDCEDVPVRTPGFYTARHTLPGRFLKAGTYSITVGAGTPDRMTQQFQDLLRFEVEELSENTNLRGYRKERPGHIISPGRWQTNRQGEGS